MSLDRKYSVEPKDVRKMLRNMNDQKREIFCSRFMKEILELAKTCKLGVRTGYYSNVTYSNVDWIIEAMNCALKVVHQISIHDTYYRGQGGFEEENSLIAINTAVANLVFCMNRVDYGAMAGDVIVDIPIWEMAQDAYERMAEDLLALSQPF